MSINDALPEETAKPAEPCPGTNARAEKGRKAAKGNIARQKATQRNRKPSGRKFKLSPKALKELRESSGKGFLNVYRDGSTYHACVAAIRKLGVGRFHRFEKIVPAVIAQMGKTADAFKTKKSRSQETGTDWKERIVQNVRVLARADYGAKLRQVGYEVRTDREKGAGVFRVVSK